MDQNQNLYQNILNQNVFAASFPATNPMSVNLNQEIHLQKALATNLANTDFMLINPNLQFNQNILGQNALAVAVITFAIGNNMGQLNSNQPPIKFISSGYINSLMSMNSAMRTNNPYLNSEPDDNITREHVWSRELIGS